MTPEFLADFVATKDEEPPAVRYSQVTIEFLPPERTESGQVWNKDYRPVKLAEWQRLERRILSGRLRPLVTKPANPNGSGSPARLARLEDGRLVNDVLEARRLNPSLR